VNLETMPEGRDRYLADSKMVIQPLTAERDLLIREPGGSSSGALAVGGVDFDQAVGEQIASGVVSEPTTASSKDAFRGATPRCADFESLRFPRLRKTKDEIDDLAKRWPKALGALTPLSGPGATEAQFKRQAPGHRVLHLATHGFFLGEGCPSALRGGKTADDARAVAADENPLILSGIAFAGANLRASATSGDDGILTAEEVTTLDLSGTALTVLSACNSGAGTLVYGEGVQGLCRAFQIAGTRSVVTSLWEMQDAVAHRWMRAFYDAYLTEPHDAVIAARVASRTLLKKLREQGESTRPSAWGGFTAVGQ
jgi:CHAT domain-containing protein